MREFVLHSSVAESMSSSLIVSWHLSNVSRFSCISGLLGPVLDIDWVPYHCNTKHNSSIKTTRFIAQLDQFSWPRQRTLTSLHVGFLGKVFRLHFPNSFCEVIRSIVFSFWFHIARRVAFRQITNCNPKR